MRQETVRVGKRGSVVIPAALRREYRLDEGATIIVEPVNGGILLKPAATFPVEVYSVERKAEFLLNNAVTPEDYAWAVREVRKLGLDPAKVPHKPPGIPSKGG